jgi:hypothetical protein
MTSRGEDALVSEMSSRWQDNLHEVKCEKVPYFNRCVKKTIFDHHIGSKKIIDYLEISFQ